MCPQDYQWSFLLLQSLGQVCSFYNVVSSEGYAFIEIELGCKGNFSVLYYIILHNNSDLSHTKENIC